MLKKIIKRNKLIYKLLLNSREILRILYNQKTRSRFLWKIRKGDIKLTLNYPLTKNSLVVDVGAYKGEFTEKLNNKFHCRIYALEPITEYYEYLTNKFSNHPNVRIYNYGLLDETKSMMISSLEAGSSIFQRLEGSTNNEVLIKSVKEFFDEEKIEEIDLLYLNIEGSEYKLLDQLIESGLINKIKHLQVQFHNYIDDASNKRQLIRKHLDKTHKCIFNFPFIWERWDRQN